MELAEQQLFPRFIQVLWVGSTISRGVERWRCPRDIPLSGMNTDRPPMKPWLPHIRLPVATARLFDCLA